MHSAVYHPSFIIPPLFIIPRLSSLLSCHVCTVPDSHYLIPEVTFPGKTAQSKCVDEIHENDEMTVTSESNKFLKQCPKQQAFYPRGKCDSAANKGDCSLLWYVNTWVMKW
jgi:hypothetical protein